MKRSLWIIAFLVLMMTFTSLSVMAAPKVRITHLTYPSHGDSWAAYLNDRAKLFNAQNPDIEVEILVSDSNYVTKFTVMLAGGTPPDVTDFYPALGATQIVNGMFADLRPYLSRSGINIRQIIPPSVVQALTTPNGAIWGMPADIYPVATFYNEDILDRAGLPYPKDLGAKWNWEQALSIGRKATTDSNGDGIPEIWGLDRMANRPYIWVHQAGGHMYDKLIAPTKSTWNTSEVIEGLNFPLTAMNDKVAARPSMPGFTQTFMWFGKAAISVVDGPGIIGAYLKEVPFRWNVAQQVAGPANAGSEIAVDSFQIVDASSHKDQAWKWLQFISLDVDSHARFVEMTGRAPSLIQLQRRYAQLSKHVPSNFMAFFDVAALPTTQIEYMIPQRTEITTATNPILRSLWSGEIPLETAVTQIHNHVNAILAGK